MSHNRRLIRKRSFLLFELLISLALIALCLFPLIKPHVTIKRIENSYLENVFFETRSHIAYCKLKELLHEHKIPWKQLESFEGEIPDDPLKNNFVFQGRKYICRFKIEEIDHKKRKNQETAMALEASFMFTYNHKNIGPYTFAFTAEKKNV